jgi:hypothetical protein
VRLRVPLELLVKHWLELVRLLRCYWWPWQAVRLQLLLELLTKHWLELVRLVRCYW